MVTALASKHNLDISPQELKAEAMKWEMNQKSMSGRTAKQFINNLVWHRSSLSDKK